MSDRVGPAEPLRIAMWSGPRNISTAMMRAWGARGDAFVCDEPLYAHYLAETGIDHPGRDEVLAHHERDWRKVVAGLLGPIPSGKRVYYQKHMAHHLLPGVGREWLGSLTHCFLIRDPREMLLSLAKHLPNPRLEDTGLPQQVELFDRVAAGRGSPPPVLDARDVLLDPRRHLSLLCEAVGVEFDDAMLHWPPGRRDTDGVWAHHWYDAVERSTGFEPYRPRTGTLPPEMNGLLAECEACYRKLFAHRLGKAGA